jgi:glycine cleavage system H protein
MSAPRELRYTKTHEWVRVEGDIAIVGITDFAQEQLSDLTFVELPAPDDEFEARDEVASVESVKAAADVYAPVSGTIVEVNTRVVDSPELVNADPFGDGWLFKLRIKNRLQLKSLLDADQYEELLPEEEE